MRSRTSPSSAIDISVAGIGVPTVWNRTSSSRWTTAMPQISVCP
jgi:hypothetical protein